MGFNINLIGENWKFG